MKKNNNKQIKHTPGPWNVIYDEEEGHYDVYVPDKKVGTVYIAKEIAQGNDEGKVDANLIAAVPEMCAAVKLFNEGWDNFLKKTNIGKSNYSAAEINWMNEIDIAMTKAIKKAALILAPLLFLLSSCSLFDAPDYTVDPRLIHYVESFYSEAASRGVSLPREINVKVTDISDYGRTRHRVSRSPIVWIDSNFLNLYGSGYASEIEVIVFHELGHALLDRCHTTNPESIMNVSPCINCYNGKPELREKYLDELFQ